MKVIDGTFHKLMIELLNYIPENYKTQVEYNSIYFGQLVHFQEYIQFNIIVLEFLHIVLICTLENGLAARNIWSYNQLMEPNQMTLYHKLIIRKLDSVTGRDEECYILKLLYGIWQKKLGR